MGFEGRTQNLADLIHGVGASISPLGGPATFPKQFPTFDRIDRYNAATGVSDLQKHLQERFGLIDFRPAQREVIEDVLAGKDVLCVMPTGAGKSLCFQLPAAVSEKLTIVVSPLISLMQDQVQQLRDEGIPAAMLNSALDSDEQRNVLAELNNGFKGLLYVAPSGSSAPASPRRWPGSSRASSRSMKRTASASGGTIFVPSTRGSERSADSSAPRLPSR